VEKEEEGGVGRKESRASMSVSTQAWSSGYSKIHQTTTITHLVLSFKTKEFERWDECEEGGEGSILYLRFQSHVALNSHFPQHLHLKKIVILDYD